MKAIHAQETAPTAADALVSEVPTVRPEVVTEGQRVAEWLRSLGLGMLSTTPAGLIRPFTRRPLAPLPTLGVGSRVPDGWTVTRHRSM